MAISTSLTKRLGIEHPVMLAPVGFISGGALAAAVSAGGGFGIIGGGYADPDWLEGEFALAGNCPVGCGFITWALAKRPATLDLALSHHPPTIMLSFGDATPFLPKVTGQEDYIYVWTLGIKGVADGNDSIVTVDANPKSASYGKIVHRAPVPGQHEAHHAGFTDDRRFLWAGGLDTSQIFVFDVASDPARPKLVKTISTFVKDTGGLVGPPGVVGPDAQRASVCP